MCTKMIHISNLFGKMLKPEKIPDIVSHLEKNRIWVLFLPCWSILSEKHLQYAILLALRDFKLHENRAKKINIQLLLRFFGENQISKVLKKARIEKNEPVCLIIFSEKNVDVKEKLDTVVSLLKKTNLMADLTDKFICKPDINRIMKLYGITSDELHAVSRNKNEIGNLSKLIFERMALAFLK